ncbi:ribosome maturation factor RimP [Piscinibacter sakaiensis]|uniref:ribosome maturation factor RimP n=1 Tax=Piscinibacter sakaiensis TaxID=1547922 RepID=UPI003AAA8C93
MNWLDAVERTVTALGYDLVDTERAGGGLLRVYIDRVPGHDYETGAGEFITVDDCEKVTRQLQHVLEVEGAAYERLEVSSPGLDRPLKREADYARFAGENVAITLKLPFKGRKKFQGLLQRAGEGWRLVLKQPEAKKGNVKGKGPVKGKKVESGLKPLPQAISPQGASQEEAPQLALDFTLDEVREARLVPVLDFKGRRFTEQAASQTASADAPVAGDHVDGGRDK